MSIPISPLTYLRLRPLLPNVVAIFPLDLPLDRLTWDGQLSVSLISALAPTVSDPQARYTGQNK